MKKFNIILLTILFVLVGLSVTNGASSTGAVATGTSMIEKTPDQTVILFTIVTSGKTSEAAQAQNSLLSSQVYQSFLADGLDRKSWKTESMELSPTYDPDSSKRKITGFQMTHQVMVTLDGTNRAGSVVKLIVDSGVDKIDYVQFKLKDPFTTQKEAMALATKDAKEKAEIMASAAGVEIKNVRYIGEPTVQYNTNASYVNLSAYKGKEVIDIAEHQLWAGDIQISAIVRIVFNLLP